MDGNMLLELETAARVLVNPSDRNALKVSENIILNFQKSRLPYSTCLQLLEMTTEELILFETIKLIKNAVVFEWHGITDEEKNLLRQRLLNYVTNQLQLPLSVREKILQIISIIIKRKYIDDSGEELKQLINEIKSMIYSGNPDQQILACMMILSMLQEFNNTVKSDDVCLTFEEHFKAKKFFELKELLNVFVLILKPMEELGKVFDVENKAHFNLMKYFLQIMELILSWGYLAPIIPKRLLNACETMANINQTPPLRISGTWKIVMLNSSTVELFNFIYWKVRSNPELQPRAMTCLIQLSTLNGSVFISGGSDASFMYFSNYLNYYLELLKNIEIQECEALGFSLILRKLFVFHDPKQEFIRLPEPVTSFLLEKMLYMALSFCEEAVKEDMLYLNNSNYTDAFRNILEAWLEILNLSEFPRQQQIKDCTTLIFNKFVETHLASQAKTDIENSLEMNEDDEIDRDLYKEQLIIIGFFGRLNLEHSLKSLASLLEEKVQMLYGHLSCLQPNSSFNSKSGNSLATLFEDLHWILLISGHVICMESEGETAMIPKEVNEFSIEQLRLGQVDVNSTLNLLMNSTSMNQFNPANCDFVVRIVSSVFRLSEIENNSFQSGLAYYLSPLTSSTLMWFIKLWANSYLYIDPVFYSPFSDVYGQVLGIDKDGSKWALNYVLGKICFNIHNYFNEIDVVEDSLSVFLDVVHPKSHKLQYIVNMQNFNALIQIKDVELDSKIKRSVYKGLVLASNVFKEQTLRNVCLDHILESINNKFDAIQLALTENGGNYQNTELRMRIVALLEELSGVIEGSNTKTYEYIYTALHKIYVMLPELMKIYHNYIDVVVGIMKLLIESASVTLLASENKQNILKNFYECTLSCLQNYFKHNIGRMLKEYTDENDSPEDIELLILLLQKVLIKNLLQPTETGDFQDVTKLGIYILSNLLPTIYPILEKFPNICLAYFKTLNIFVESVVVYGSELRNIPSELMSCMLYTVRIGLTSFASADIQNLCLEVLSTVGHSIYSDTGDVSIYITQIVQPFVKLLFEIIFTLDLQQENRTECFGSIYVLSCCNAEAFYTVLRQLVEEQRQKLKENVYILNSPELFQLQQFPFKFSRDQRNQFVDMFEKFIASLSILYKN